MKFVSSWFILRAFGKAWKIKRFLNFLTLTFLHKIKLIFYFLNFHLFCLILPFIYSISFFIFKGKNLTTSQIKLIIDKVQPLYDWGKLKKSVWEKVKTNDK